MSSLPVRIKNHISRYIQFRGNTQCDTNLMQTESEWTCVAKRLQSTHYIPILLKCMFVLCVIAFSWLFNFNNICALIWKTRLELDRIYYNTCSYLPISCGLAVVPANNTAIASQIHGDASFIIICCLPLFRC